MKTLILVLVAVMAIFGLASAAELSNTVVASGEYNGTVTKAEDATTVTINETVKVDFYKDVDVKVAKPGDILTYRYIVTNLGTAKITGITVADNDLGNIKLDATSLGMGESAVGTMTLTVKKSDLPGPKINYAVMKATSNGAPLLMNASASVELFEPVLTPSIEVIKTSDVDVTDIGKTVTYTYVVTNTGDAPLSNVTAVDAPLGKITLAKTSLNPGESTTGTLKHLVTLEDVTGVPAPTEAAPIRAATVVDVPPATNETE